MPTKASKFDAVSSRLCIAVEAHAFEALNLGMCAAVKAPSRNLQRK